MDIAEGIDAMEGLVDGTTEFDADIPSGMAAISILDDDYGREAMSCPHLKVSIVVALRSVRSSRVFMNFPQLTL